MKIEIELTEEEAGALDTEMAALQEFWTDGTDAPQLTMAEKVRVAINGPRPWI